MDQKTRRLYLSFVVKLLIVLGIGAAAVPFVASMTGKPDNAGTVSAKVSVEVDVADLKAGEIRKTQWRGREVWILRRSAQDLANLDQLTPYLQDPDSESSVQPALARNPHRSLQPELFVFYPTENLRTCQVTWHGPQEPPGGAEPWHGGFAEQCFGARYDLAGRIYKDTGKAGQHNLSVPAYIVIDGRRVQLVPVAPSSR